MPTIELGSFNPIFTYFYQLELQICKIEVAKSVVKRRQHGNTLYICEALSHTMQCYIIVFFLQKNEITNCFTFLQDHQIS